MKKKATVFLLSLMALLLFAAAAETVATAGSQSDPVVALSYLQTTFQPAIIRQAEEMAEEAFSESFEELSKRLEAMDAEYALYASYYLKNAAMTNDTVISKNKGTKYSLKKGTIVTGIIGTGYVLESGHAMVYAPEGGSIVDMTEGIDMYHGLPLTAGHGYIVPAEGSYGIVITSDTANVCVTDTHRVIGFVLHRSLDSGTTLPPGTTNIAYTPKYTKYADALKAMGLFRGTNSGYELDRAATRVEAIVMLIRILGEENNALSFKGTHPFTDVPSWANCYVAYAYEKGYTAGVSADLFGAGREVTQTQYLTFILRALGYDDSAGDFLWSEAADKCVAEGVLGRSDAMSTADPFYRDQVAYCSYIALYANLKNSKLFLVDRLQSSGAVTSDMISTAAMIVAQ